MPDVTIEIGGREFSVACQAGEEPFLHSAARMLDAEAQTLLAQIGRVPEARMLLMAGLMLADRTTALEESLARAEEQIRAAQAELAALRDRPAPPPERIEVPVIPRGLHDTLAEIAARAESLADRIEEARA